MKLLISLKFLKVFVAGCASTAILAISSANAAVVYPTSITSHFSDNQWSPSTPVDGDIIDTAPLNRRIFADVQGRIISLFIQHGSGGTQLTAPVFSYENWSLSRGAPTPSAPVRIYFPVDSKIVDVSTNTADLVQSFLNVFFFDFFNNTIISPDAKFIIHGDNINGTYFPVNITGAAIPGGAGIADFVGPDDSSGTNITFVGTLSNLKSILIRENNFFTATQSVSIGGKVVLYNNVRYQIPTGLNLTATAIVSDAATSNSYLIMSGDNILDAMIGQGADIPITDAMLLAGTGDFYKAVKFTGDVTQLASTILNVRNNFTAARLVPVGTGQIFSINTAGTAIIDANIGSNGNTPVPYISIIGGGIGEFKQDVNVSISITLGNNSAIRFDKNVTGPLLTPNLTGTTVEFANPSPAIANIVIGPINRNINVLKFSGTDVTLPQSIFTNTINFSNATTPANITVGATQNVTVPITTAATTRIHNIYASATIDRNASTGSNTNPFGAFYLTNNNIININNTSFYSDVQTTTNNTGTVNFVVPESFSYSLGNKYRQLTEIKFTENAEVRGSAYAKNIIIPAGKEASFRSRLAVAGYIVVPFVRATDGLILQGAGSKAIFGDLAEVRGNIITSQANQGEVLFESNINLRAPIGSETARVGKVNFMANSRDKVITLARDIHADDINFNAAIIDVAVGGVLDGNTTMISPEINFGQHIVIFTGGESQFLGNPVFNIYFDNHSNSHITAREENTVIDLTNVDSLRFNINDQSEPPETDSNVLFKRIYNFYRYENGGNVLPTDRSKVIIQQNNPLAKWLYSNGQLLQFINASQGLIDVIEASGSNISRESIENTLELFARLDSKSSDAFLEYLVTTAPMSQASTGRYGQGALANNIPTTGAAVLNIIQAVNPTAEIITNNISSYQSNIINSRIDNKLPDISAGDNNIKNYGLWIEPLYGTSHQKMRLYESGYKTRYYGFTLGTDTEIKDTLILGFAGSFIENKINYRDLKSGNKTNIKTFLASIYSLYEINDDWYISSILSMASNHVKNDKRRINIGGDEIAKSKYRANAYGGEINIGYNYHITDNSMLLPIIGARYNRFGANHYKETNTTLALNVAKQSYNKLEMIFGGKLISPYYLQDHLFITQLHSFVNYDLINKAQKALVNLEGSNSYFTPALSQKPIKIIYNIGGSISSGIKFLEYSLNYNLTLGKKLIGHQVGVKLRMKF